uniref:Methylenetetrahydrofolate dehydrogenase (NADP+ dependent) 2 like n=1 Tax=Anas platyrhynchos TaxID=8839 RepID=A0A8B9ZG60_ANAPL
MSAMGALSEESAITVSSLSTELWNNWTKNNTEEYTEQPRLLKLMQTCLEEHHSYCINGLCAFHSELRKPICKCLAGYNGERCEHLTLNSYAHNSYERYIAVGIGIGILTSGILAIIYCYVRKRYGRRVTFSFCSTELQWGGKAVQSFDKGIGSMFLHLLCDLEGADAQYFCFLTCQLYNTVQLC